jgi:transcriptional regulator with XRE-family HTH domain
MELTGNHLKAARAIAGLDQAALADLAGVSVNTIRNMEAAGRAPVGGRASTRDTVQAALEKVGVEFSNGGEPGVRLRRGARARKPAKNATPTKRDRGKSPTSVELAAREIDRIVDKTATAEEQASRKRRLIAGPKEFRGIRRK